MEPDRVAPELLRRKKMKCVISSQGSLQEQQAGTHLAAYCQAAAATAYELYVSCESCDLVAETNEATLVRGTAPSCGDNACETEKLARSRFHSHTHIVHTHTFAATAAATPTRSSRRRRRLCRSRVTGSSCAVKVFSTTSARHTTHTSVEEKEKHSLSSAAATQRLPK